MWRAHPLGWLSSSYRVEEHGDLVGTLTFGSWSERGAILLDTAPGGKRRLTIRREGFWRPKFLLADTVASGQPSGLFRRGFDLVYGDEEYHLDPSSLFGRSYDLSQRGRYLGRIRSLGIFSRRFEIELDEALPPELRLFAFWMVLMAMRRGAAAAAAS